MDEGGLLMPKNESPTYDHYFVVSIKELKKILAGAEADSRRAQKSVNGTKGVRAMQHSTTVLRFTENETYAGQLRLKDWNGKGLV